MENNPLVSIIIPVYNVEKYVGRCLSSALAQTYSNTEVVIVNDCTPDSSMAVIEELLSSSPSKDKVRIISHQRNCGLAVARNTGVEAAAGEFVMHLDSDDYIEADTVEKAVRCMNDNDADAVVFGMRHIFPKSFMIERVSVPLDHKEYIRQLICRRNNVCMCGGLYKRSLYMDNGIRAIPGLNMGEDYSTKPRLLYFAGKVAGLDEPLHNYIHSNQESYTRTYSKKHIDDVIKALDVLKEFFDSRSDGAEYRQALEIAAVSSKVLLVKGWAAADSEDALLDVINAIDTEGFPCSASQRMLLALAKRKSKFLLRSIVRNGLRTKQLFRRIAN